MSERNKTHKCQLHATRAAEVHRSPGGRKVKMLLSTGTYDTYERKLEELKACQ